MEKTLKSSSLNYGIYLGLVLAAFTILGYVMLDLFTQWWFGILMLLVILVFGIVSSMSARKLLGGFISFKEAFTAYFITVLVGLLIGTLVSFVIFNVVDPDASAVLQDKIIETQIEMMQNFGTPQEAIDTAIAEARATNMYSIGNLAKSLAFQLIGYSIAGLLVALVVKKNDPHAA